LDLSVVISEYEQRYPMLRWNLIGQRFKEGIADIETFINQYSLQSARVEVLSFINEIKNLEIDKQLIPKKLTFPNELLTNLTYTAEDAENDFLNWMDGINERANISKKSFDEKLSQGLCEFNDEEAEIEHHLVVETLVIWLDEWDVPDEPLDPEEESIELEEQRRIEEEFEKINQQMLRKWVNAKYDEQELEDYQSEYLDEVEPETFSYHEWDDIDNFWNQEGVFEEMSDMHY
jgi:hypothetical protein